MTTTPTSDALATITQRAPLLQPRIAVVLGSGWGGLTDHIRDAVPIPYTELEGFPQPTVAGHSATLWLGHIGTQPVAVMSGRKHGYETGAVDGMAAPLQVLQQLGCHTLVQTNAAGSVRPDMPPQSLMLIADHLNLPQRSPLVGQSGSERFARTALACLDLTSLNDQDDEAAIDRAVRASGRPAGAPAALCVWPRWRRAPVPAHRRACVWRRSPTFPRAGRRRSRAGGHPRHRRRRCRRGRPRAALARAGRR
jgi:hypothetical protein